MQSQLPIQSDTNLTPYFKKLDKHTTELSVRSSYIFVSLLSKH